MWDAQTFAPEWMSKQEHPVLEVLDDIFVINSDTDL